MRSTLRRRHLVARHRQDHHVAVGDVHPLLVDNDEQRVEVGVLAFSWCGAQHHPAGRRHVPHHLARDGGVEVDRRQRNQRRCNAFQLTLLRPVQVRRGLHDRQQRRGHRQHESDQPGDGGHPARQLHVVACGAGGRMLGLCASRECSNRSLSAPAVHGGRRPAGWRRSARHRRGASGGIARPVPSRGTSRRSDTSGWSTSTSAPG